MKIHIVTNEQGEVIATSPAGKLSGGVEIMPEPTKKGYTVHTHVEVPEDLAKLKVDEFHKRLKPHLPK